MNPKVTPANIETKSRPASSAALLRECGGLYVEAHIGFLLSDELGIELRRVGSGKRMTFTCPGEAKLSPWMEEHVRIVRVEHARTWILACVATS